MFHHTVLVHCSDTRRPDGRSGFTFNLQCFEFCLVLLESVSGTDPMHSRRAARSSIIYTHISILCLFPDMMCLVVCLLSQLTQTHCDQRVFDEWISTTERCHDVKGSHQCVALLAGVAIFDLISFLQGLVALRACYMCSYSMSLRQYRCDPEQFKCSASVLFYTVPYSGVFSC